MTSLPTFRLRPLPLLAGAAAASVALAVAWASHAATESTSTTTAAQSAPSRIVVAGAYRGIGAGASGQGRATPAEPTGARAATQDTPSPTLQTLTAMFDRAAHATVPPGVAELFSLPNEALGALCLPSLKHPLRFFCQYSVRELTLAELEALAIAGNASAAAFWFDSQSYETDLALRETARQIMLRRAGLGDPSMYVNLAGWYRATPDASDDDRAVALGLDYAAWLSELWGENEFTSPELATLATADCQRAMAVGVQLAARHGWDMKERAREAANGVRDALCSPTAKR